MGVLGLTPFIQKTCPQVIKQLPNRLQGLTGKKIVIDGTLITQRLHFAQSPHPYRHVLGWYRIAEECSQHGIAVACVFDGKERNLAKTHETERRRYARSLTLARGSLERGRYKRLSKLKAVLHHLNELDKDETNLINGFLQKLDLETEPSPADTAQQFQKAVSSTPPDQRLPADTAVSGVSAIRGSTYAGLWPKRCTNVQDDGIPYTDTEVSDDNLLDISTHDLPATLNSLYYDYRNSMSQLAILPAPPSSPAPLPSLLADTQTEQIMSKAQYRLAVEEGKLWHDLIFQSFGTRPPVSAPDVSTFPEDHVANLAHQSLLMSDSYTRRTNIPTISTYDECKEILQAMGIPCIESSGPFEAEALASSMVLHGLADYVASEDTDVLVYEVPLIRNISTRQEDLTVMSGAHLRSALGLGRNSYIDFALLLGTDFSQRIKNLGPSRAYKFIKEYGSIERIIASEIKYPPRLPIDIYLEQIDIARNVFQNLPPIPQGNLLEQKEKDHVEVNHVMQRYGLGKVLMNSFDWDYHGALSGNYFEDDPSF